MSRCRRPYPPGRRRAPAPAAPASSCRRSVRLPNRRQNLLGEQLELALLDVEGRGALLEELPDHPVELSLLLAGAGVAGVELLHLAADVVDGAAEQLPRLDEALGQRGL